MALFSLSLRIISAILSKNPERTMRDAPSSDRLTKEQKTGFVLLLVFGLCAVGMGLLQMRNTIYGPFVLKKKTDTNQTAPLVVDESEQLQAIDTDQDGLSNYEELFFYQTSPYLPDTDSDGIGDREEIATGSDPNCAEGKVCAADVLADVTTTPDVQIGLPGADPTLEVLGDAGLIAEPNAADIADIATLFQDPQQLRVLLRQSGQLTEDQLAQIDDETLLKLVDELLAQQFQSTSTATSTP